MHINYIIIYYINILLLGREKVYKKKKSFFNMNLMLKTGKEDLME